MHLARNALALHFVGLVADAQRKYIGPRQHRVDFDFGSIEAAGPATVRSIQVEPVVLAVDGDVVSHEEQWSVASGQLPVVRCSIIASPPCERQSSSWKRHSAYSRCHWRRGARS